MKIKNNQDQMIVTVMNNLNVHKKKMIKRKNKKENNHKEHKKDLKKNLKKLRKNMFKKIINLLLKNKKLKYSQKLLLKKKRIL